MSIVNVARRRANNKIRSRSSKEPVAPGSSTGILERLLLPAILLLTFITFSGTLSNFAWGWDDDKYIHDNPYIKDMSWRGLGEIFSSTYMSNYHPLTTLMWTVEYHFFGLSAKVFHWVNLIVHLCNVIVIFQFSKRLVGNLAGGAIVAGLFAVHPMHVESVAWISERKDVLYCLFFFLSLSAYLKWITEKNSTHFLLAFVWFVLSCLSKPAAVILPLVLVLMDWFKLRSQDGQRTGITPGNVLAKTPFFIVSIIIGWITIQAQEADQAFSDMGYSVFETFFLVSYSVAFYLVKAVIPTALSALYYYPDRAADSLSLLYWLSPGLLLLCGAAAYRLKEWRRELLFCGGFLMINLLLILKYTPVGYALVADRYTYVPYIGLFLLVAYLYVKADGGNTSGFLSPKVIGWGCTGLVLGLAFLANDRCKDWKDGEQLFGNVIGHDPERYPAYYIRANIRAHFGNVNGALSDYNASITLESKFANSYYNRGLMREKVGDMNGAYNDYDQCIQFDEEHAKAYYNRAVIRERLGISEGVLADYDRAIEFNPNYALAYNNRGNLKLNEQDYDAAVLDYTQALTNDPAFPLAWYNRGVAKYYLSDREGSCQDYEVAASLGYEQAKESVKKYCQ